jgi:hypothetical protein
MDMVVETSSGILYWRMLDENRRSGGSWKSSVFGQSR